MNILNENNRLIDSKYIEELFTDLQLNQNVNSTLNSIKKILNKSFQGTCEDIYIGNKTNDKKIYGMCVYPTVESLRELSLKIIKFDKEQSKEITKFVIGDNIRYIIEIDPNLLYSKFINFTPAELTAVLLHELGHVTADSDFYNDLAFAYNNALYNLANDKSKLADNGFRVNNKEMQVGMLYILSSIQSTQIINKGNAQGEIERERIADKFVIDNEYGEALSSALKKLSKYYLNNYKKQTKKDYERQMQLEAENIISLSKSFDMRRNYVDEVLDAEMKKTPSNFLKKTLADIKSAIKGFMPKYKPVSQACDSRPLRENFIMKLYKNPMKISQADIDDLSIQVEMMDDWDDKSVIVYKIHKRLAQLAQASEKYSNDKELLTIIERYRKELNELLKKAMKFKPVQKSYGVFIKYPKGYEG